MRHLLRLGLAVAAALALSPLAGAGSAAAAAKRTTVQASGGPVALLWQWDPEAAEVRQHGTVVWTNPTSAEHHVAAYGGNWSYDKHLPAGEKVSKRFRKPGTYLYRCTLVGHSEMVGDDCVGMCGEIVVTGHTQHQH